MRHGQYAGQDAVRRAVWVGKRRMGSARMGYKVLGFWSSYDPLTIHVDRFFAQFLLADANLMMRAPWSWQRRAQFGWTLLLSTICPRGRFSFLELLAALAQAQRALSESPRGRPCASVPHILRIKLHGCEQDRLYGTFAHRGQRGPRSRRCARLSGVVFAKQKRGRIDSERFLGAACHLFLVCYELKHDWFR